MKISIALQIKINELESRTGVKPDFIYMGTLTLKLLLNEHQQEEVSNVRFKSYAGIPVIYVEDVNHLSVGYNI